jgi:hypothetical protein
VPPDAPETLIRLLCKEFGWTMEYAGSRTFPEIYGELLDLVGKDSPYVQVFLRNNRGTILRRDDGTYYSPDEAQLRRDAIEHEKRYNAMKVMAR